MKGQAKTILRRAVCNDVVHQNPLAQHVLTRRDVANGFFNSYALTGLKPVCDTSAERLKKTAEFLWQAISERQKIVIVGDYDADGATSTALGVWVLRSMGAAVDFVVPNRFTHGYGLSVAIVEEVFERHRPDLLITVDNGIVNFAGVARAKALGMKVIITDHHLPGPQLPQADFIVNPNVPGDPLPSPHLAGVGVLFYLLAEVRKVARQKEHPAGELRLGNFLDIVALGTVADVVRLDENNRILVHNGLQNIRNGSSVRPGIRALAKVSGLKDLSHITTSDFGFKLGPRLNAAGRLETMEVGIRCLLSETEEEADAWAVKLHEYNHERQDRQEEMVEAAKAQVEGWRAAGVLPEVLVLCDAGWHEGIVGLVASRIKELYHRPAVAFAPSQEEGILKGSARSIEGFHIRDALVMVDRDYPGLLQKFGGHAMAAGVTIRVEDFEKFTNALLQVGKKALDPKSLEPVIWSDGEISPDFFGQPSVVKELQMLPWGQGFPPPQFDGVFELLEQSLTLKKGYLQLLLRVPGAKQNVTALFFRNKKQLLPNTCRRVRMVYTVHWGIYQEREQVSLFIDYLEIEEGDGQWKPI